MHLGIDKDAGWIYEGLGGPEIPMPPGVTVTQAMLIESEGDWNNLPRGLWQDPMRWVFREDGFDAVTRTRRGRLYQPASSSQPNSVLVAPHSYELRSEQQKTRHRNLYTFIACSALLQHPRRGVGRTLVLGDSQMPSAWRIVQAERLANGCVMLLLKSLSAFGMVPEIDADKVAAQFRSDVGSAVDRVLDAAFRESPVSVVDQCRNALTVLVSRWIVQCGGNPKVLGKDLGDLAALVEADPHRLGAVSWACRVVARLHSRGKDNERIVKGYRLPQKGDAGFAIEAVGFVLRELDWARP